MTETHRMILDELNKVYECEPSLANANKLISFVEEELPVELKRAVDNSEGTILIVNALIFLFYTTIGLFFTKLFFRGLFLSIGQALLIGILLTTILLFSFTNKLYTLIMNGYNKAKPERFKIFDLYFKAKYLKNKNDFKEKGQSLVAKYLDRNGNAVEVEKFKLDSPKDSILVKNSNNDYWIKNTYYQGNEILDFKPTDKLLVVGVSGKGKTTFLERCALKLHEEGRPFVYVTSNSSYLWHQLELLKAKLPQSSLDFYNNFAKTSSPDALLVELEKNDCREIIISGIEQITKALDNGAFLFLDEAIPLLYIPELKAVVVKALDDVNSGVAIAWQEDPERINDEHGLLSKVNYVVETAFSPKRNSEC